MEAARRPLPTEDTPRPAAPRPLPARHGRGSRRRRRRLRRAHRETGPARARGSRSRPPRPAAARAAPLCPRRGGREGRLLLPAAATYPLPSPVAPREAAGAAGQAAEGGDRARGGRRLPGDSAGTAPRPARPGRGGGPGPRPAPRSPPPQRDGLGHFGLRRCSPQRGAALPCRGPSPRGPRGLPGGSVPPAPRLRRRARLSLGASQETSAQAKRWPCLGSRRAVSFSPP